MKKDTATVIEAEETLFLLRAAHDELVSYHPCAGPVSLVRVSYFSYLFAPTKPICLVKKTEPRGRGAIRGVIDNGEVRNNSSRSVGTHPIQLGRRTARIEQ